MFFFETGSLVGFVVLKLPLYFLQRARKLAQNLLEPKNLRTCQRLLVELNSYQLLYHQTSPPSCLELRSVAP